VSAAVPVKRWVTPSAFAKAAADKSLIHPKKFEPRASLPCAVERPMALRGRVSYPGGDKEIS